MSSTSNPPCDGCDGALLDAEHTRAYVVTDHQGATHAVHYCDGCADLARQDWNGETADLALAPGACEIVGVC